MENYTSQPNEIKKEYIKDAYSVNSSAEAIINFLATVLLVLGMIISITAIIGGIAYLDSDSGMMDSSYGIGGIVGGIILLLIFLVQWAWFKLMVNISRNLFNINELLKRKL